MQDLLYKVAELNIRVSIPDGLVPSRLLPSFVPFAVEDGDAPALEVYAPSRVDIPEGMAPAVQETNDMGLTEIFSIAEDYVLRFTFMGLTSILKICKGCARAEIDIDFSNRYAGHVLTSMIRTAFAQTLVFHDGISLHSSTVVYGGRGYMFLGTSGTGKSTHSRMWMSAYPEAELLNDDNPIVRFIDGELIVFGTPWSGKTPCYRNASAPVAAIVRLSQAPENRIQILQSVQAFIEIYQGTSVLRTDHVLHDRMCDILGMITEKAKIAHLYCLPDEAAARLCHDSLQ